jgi:hypothetical protein
LTLRLLVGLLSIILIGPTVRGDSLSSSKDGSSGASPGTVPSTTNAIKLERGGTGGSTPTGRPSESTRDVGGSPLLPDAILQTGTPRPTDYRASTELPIFAGKGNPTAQGDGGVAADSTIGASPLNGLFRMFAFGIAGFFLVRRVRHRWHTNEVRSLPD